MPLKLVMRLEITSGLAEGGMLWRLILLTVSWEGRRVELNRVLVGIGGGATADEDVGEVVKSMAAKLSRGEGRGGGETVERWAVDNSALLEIGLSRRGTEV